METADRLRVTKTGLEVTNEKLEAELEETKHRLREALSRPITEGADSKTWKASVVTRSANRFLFFFLSNLLKYCFSGCSQQNSEENLKALMNWVFCTNCIDQQ